MENTTMSREEIVAVIGGADWFLRTQRLNNLVRAKMRSANISIEKWSHTFSDAGEPCGSMAGQQFVQDGRPITRRQAAAACGLPLDTGDDPRTFAFPEASQLAPWAY